MPRPYRLMAAALLAGSLIPSLAMAQPAARPDLSGTFIHGDPGLLRNEVVKNADGTICILGCAAFQPAAAPAAAPAAPAAPRGPNRPRL